MSEERKEYPMANGDYILPKTTVKQPYLFEELNKNPDIFQELVSTLRTNYTSNFHFDQLDWPVKLCIKELCTILDKRLKNE
jgi:hypothetical protein